MSKNRLNSKMSSDLSSDSSRDDLLFTSSIEHNELEIL